MKIPGFQIQETIGAGGMATVYLALQESLGRSVVLKTLHKADAPSESYAERFLNEARIIAALRHPHIITIYDVGTTDELLYIAMEYVDGGDLGARIRAGLEPSEALDIVAKIASALQCAHCEGVIHRDVKPANILFRHDGTPVLSDFGIAKQITVDSELTATGTIVGSPVYMSPEQAEGTPLDVRTDIYSLGIIFYEMLTGRRAYPGDSAIKIILQHLQGPIPTLPKELERFQSFLERMAAKDREQRFGDAAAVVAAAQKLQREELTRHTPPSPPRMVATPDGPTAAIATVEGQTVVVPLAQPERKRLRALLSSLALFGAGLATFYVYTETLKIPGIVRLQPEVVETSPTEIASRLVEQSLAHTTQPANLNRAHGTIPSTPEPLRRDVMQALIWLARNSLKDDRLTHPPADNAHYYYSRLLALDPGNEQALRGFHRIAERYAVLAEQEYAHRRYKKAQAYVTIGLQVQPDHDGLHTLQSLIDERDRSWFEGLIEFVSGGETG
ncbi:MAG: serine/threonine protein kinase [Gammaproteobacteria bacterium]|nr:serine/threonine protein kinase [Gammaproteobacteria bacterium]NIR83953.1 serine/threonine protein kinase [Gammaproteobacteria bacterium]NIR88996.1 serine/threonine protein kinase [Gammaproteobacteria bacterium]NIV74549.1 protein kinase [Gammaproteobacteria bacterium]